MSFVLRSSIDCLPSLAVLKRMHKRTSTSCPLCGNHQTLHHILNFCSVSLQQGCYTWRHNSILNHLFQSPSSPYSSVTPCPTILADLPDCPLPTGSTIPPNVLCTSLRPDLVILFPSRKIIILELTVPFESNISDAHSRKTATPH